jgi:two-component system NtrC family sensor kinase
MREVQTRVERNLNVARTAYCNHLDVLAALLRGAARDRTLAAALKRKDLQSLDVMLRDLNAPRNPPQEPAQTKNSSVDRPIHETRFGNLDFVVLLDPSGKVIFRLGTTQKGDGLSTDPLISRALRERKTLHGTLVLSQERLRTEGPLLAKQAIIKIIPTEASQPVTGLVCTDGMVAAVAVPVLDTEGQLLAILYGGNLLNQHYEMVDAIRQEVFRDEVYDGKPIGTVAILLGGVRISTNAVTEDGARAVGTQLSAPVREKVLDGGGTWSAPAFVVNDWYFTAYEPIKDPGGRIIGALGVGLLQTPFVHQCSVINAVFLTFMIGTSLASLVLLVLVTESAIRPVYHVVTMAQRVIGGDLSARVGIRPAGEMGVLCRAVDSMAQSIQEREEMVQQVTRQQIGRSEHLASVGRLAAGVAHEINNPLTGVLAFADLLREKENLDEQDREDLDLIIRETKRAREIVRGLLEFARETPSRKTQLDVNDLVRRTMQLLGKREAFQNINLVEDLADRLPWIHGDNNQLQQVFVNLSLNACEAMPSGGTLLISTSRESDRVVIKVIDTGIGIKREHVDKIFEPFFTTKPVGKGTGLGLSVSYGIVQQHGGTLEVESQEGKGTTFTVTLPTARTTGA